MANDAMGWMIDAVLKSAGFDPVEAKVMIGEFVNKFVEQDNRLKRIEALLIEQNKLLAGAQSAVTSEGKSHDGHGSEDDGSGKRISLAKLVAQQR